jgi:hypothetical protein
VDDDLLRWFDAEGLVRYAAYGEPGGGVTEVVRGPLVALGPHDADYRLAPHPDRMSYPIKRLRDMTLDDYQAFMMTWFEHAIHAGDVRCANCDRRILETASDMADADTWDAIFIEKELVAWMIVHFDCKKQLPRHLKGRHPFELEPSPAHLYNLSDEIYGAATAEAGEQPSAPAARARTEEAQVG